ncbi:ATPase, T2SS/T4P/T4SS family [Paenibacillus daejeonensis]|uniref:AAA family ATPase n=1 Tax=Paenibacillus daejeonensis TaxID=135193 RepID=UPI00035C1003|nr:ATPase, T2SS/T4P/T4SS family [Paenibacillus daejeonensis]
MRSKLRKAGAIVKFLFPEIQLYGLLKEKGFVNNDTNTRSDLQGHSPSPQYTSSNPMQRGNVGVYGTSPHVPSPPHARPVESVEDISSKRMDEIFNNARNRLNGRVIGQQPFIADLTAAFKQGYMNSSNSNVRNVILLTGSAGTGKKTALDILIQELYQHNLSASEDTVEIDLSHYEEDDISGNFISDMADAFEYSDETVVFRNITEADPSVIQLVAQLAREGNFRTKEGVRVSAADCFIVFYVDHPIDEGEASQKVPSSLGGVIPSNILKTIRTAAVSLPLDKLRMQVIAEFLMKQTVLQISHQAQLKIVVEDSVYEALGHMATSYKTFGEAVQDWIEKEFIVVITGLRARNEIRRNDKVQIRYEEDAFYAVTKSIRVPIKAFSFARTESLADVMNELNELTGLASVKTFVEELMNTVDVNQRRSQEGNRKVSMAMHMVFTGNPGTGKTTVARLISRILKAMGLLSQGQLVEVSRQDLVGQYVGSTAPKTMAKVNEALGGVLFIDEAYTLARSEHDSFGLEAIDTIVKAMEDNRNDLVVIIAGYTQEMETFLRSNPGLRSRFPFIVEFPDYSPEDMLDILLRISDSNGFQIERNSFEGLRELFGQRQIPGRNDSGNGRLVRNLFEEAVRKQSTRIGKEGAADLQLLIGEDFGIGEKEAFNIENELAGVVGLEKVKAFVRALEKQLIVDQRRKDAGVSVDTAQMINMIFSGNPGTGKTTMARLLAGMLKSMGFLKKGHLVEVDRSDLVAQYVGQTASKTKVVVESALGGVLFIDEAYALAQDGVQGGGFGKEAIDTLVRLIELHKDNLVVILAGYTEDMEKFVRVNPGMASRFPLQIEFPDYTAEDMVSIAALMIKARGFRMEPNSVQLLQGYFEQKQIPGKKDGGNGRLVRNTLETAIRRQAERLADRPNTSTEFLNELIAEDFGLSSDAELVSAGSKNALSALDAVVGLGSVKSFVKSLSAQIEVAKRREQLGLPVAKAQTLHMIFKGNPGTGKTTIARILASRLKELGAIKSDTLIETDRSGLVAGYVGQTALKTKEVIERALGGVLFVDEAYALAEGDQFGKEAIDTLVKAMDDYRDRLVVILAGYDEDMDRFLDQNAGLRSRFPNIITFPDYSVDELLQIAKQMVEAQGYFMIPEANDQLRLILNGYHGQMSAGNGRLVRNLVEKAIRIHALRLSEKPDATADELSTIVAEDFKDEGDL